MRIFGGCAKRFFGRIFVEQIALKKYNRSTLHGSLRNIGSIKQRGRTEKRVHRAIAIWRNDDQTPASVFSLTSNTRKKPDTHRVKVVRERLTQSIGRNLADEARLATETCQTISRVCRRTTAHLGARINKRMQMLRPFNVDKIHRTFDDVFAHQKAFINSCQNIN